MTSGDTWRDAIGRIAEAARALSDEAKAQQDASLKSTANGLSEELLDVSRRLEELRLHSLAPPPTLADRAEAAAKTAEAEAKKATAAAEEAK
jgi:hypothetical protein